MFAFYFCWFSCFDVSELLWSKPFVCPKRFAKQKHQRLQRVPFESPERYLKTSVYNTGPFETPDIKFFSRLFFEG